MKILHRARIGAGLLLLLLETDRLWAVGLDARPSTWPSLLFAGLFGSAVVFLLGWPMYWSKDAES